MAKKKVGTADNLTSLLTVLMAFSLMETDPVRKAMYDKMIKDIQEQMKKEKENA